MNKKRRLLVNKYEKITNDILNEKCERYNISVHPKVRVADVFKIDNSGITNDLYSYALQSHFDFIIYNELYDPLFAVEFDES